VYVTGENFPADGDNIIVSDNNNGDAFVWRLEAKGGLQNYFKVIGVDGTDFGSAIALDSFHNVWVAGAVYSGDATNGAASSGDADIFELAPDGSFLHDFDLAATKRTLLSGWRSMQQITRGSQERRAGMAFLRQTEYYIE